MAFSKKRVQNLLFQLFLSALLFSASRAWAREIKLTILFTGDHHGQVDPIHPSDPSKPVGGVTRRMALIEKIRQEAGAANVLLVDGGGLFVGTAFSSLTQGEVDCAAYQLMQYDAIALGSHDFDYGKKTILNYRKQFRTPWVSANIVVRNNSQNFVRPYVLKYAGVRVGMIGFSDPNTPSLTRRDNVSGLVFNPPGASAKGLHSILKKDADLFIALSYLGPEANRKFAKDNPFLHVVIGGNGPTLSEPVAEKKADGSLAGPIWVQAGSQGLYLGRLELTVEGHRDPKTKKEEYSIRDYHYQAIPITTDLPEDPRMVELLQRYKEKLKDRPLDEVLATVSGDFMDSGSGDSFIGEVATDAMRKSAQTEVAFLANSTFRTNFKEGDLNREVLYEIYPSDSEIVAIDIPGFDLRKAIEVSATEKGNDNFLQISGMKVEKTADGLKIMVGDEPLNDKRKYLVAVDDFLAGGGGGYDFFARLKSRRKTQVMIRGLLENALKDKQKLSVADFEKRWNLP